MIFAIYSRCKVPKRCAMTRNLGNGERVIRIVIGVILLIWGYTAGAPIWGATIAYVVGAATLMTGIVGFCMVWKALGINTCQPRTSEKT